MNYGFGDFVHGSFDVSTRFYDELSQQREIV